MTDDPHPSALVDVSGFNLRELLDHVGSGVLAEALRRIMARTEADEAVSAFQSYIEAS